MSAPFLAEVDAATRRHSVAVISQGRATTYGQLSTLIAAGVERLGRIGLTPGDRVILVESRDIETIAMYVAVIRSGGVAVPASPGSNAEAVMALRRQSGARFVNRGHELTHLPAPAATGSPRTHIRAPVLNPENEPVMLMPTSGSGGAAKLVRVSLGNLVSNTADIIEALGLSHRERALLALPLSHCFGLSVVNTHLTVGGSVLVLDGPFEPFRVTRSMDEGRTTNFPAVPTMLASLLKRGALTTLSGTQLRAVHQAGGALPYDVQRGIREALPALRLYRMYGQTEATARISVLPPEDLARRPSSSGRPLGSVSIRIVRAHESASDGEIQVRGPSICSGYWADEAATANRSTGDGWARTGDQGYLDSDGFLYVTGRFDGTLKYAGKRFSAEFVEAALLQHPEIIGAAVTVVSIRSQERIVAMVESLTEALDPRAVQNWCTERLGRGWTPELIAQTSLPLTPSGKLDRRAVLAMATGYLEGTTS